VKFTNKFVVILKFLRNMAQNEDIHLMESRGLTKSLAI
jgi:hypothetical protein